jgi:hypothetical protein
MRADEPCIMIDDQWFTEKKKPATTTTQSRNNSNNSVVWAVVAVALLQKHTVRAVLRNGGDGEQRSYLREEWRETIDTDGRLLLALLVFLRVRDPSWFFKGTGPVRV